MLWRTLGMLVVCGLVGACSGSTARSAARTPTSVEVATQCNVAGVAARVVPDVIGLALAEAIRRVQVAGLHVVGTGVPVGGDPTTKTARVVAQEPGPGEHVPDGACIGFRTAR